jgi:hypothetical protein
MLEVELEENSSNPLHDYCMYYVDAALFSMHLYMTLMVLCYDAAYLSSKPCGLYQVRIQFVGQFCLFDFD